MYISANHINVKLNQDCSSYLITDDLKSLILCDGIGEFRNSSKFSEAVCEIMIKSAYKDIDELLNNDKIIKLKESKIEGGTTVLFANTTNNTDLTIEYLGNGGCIQLSGSFAKNQNNLAPYRYNNLINPHISFNGSLTRHLSHNSNNNEHKRGKLILTLNNINGDILIFFTDGINSLEENIIINDNEGRYWRNESVSLQLIIEKLNEFLITERESHDFQKSLQKFNINILEELKIKEILEDDAAIAIVITEDVLKYYQEQND
jgi:hypothetical protein